MEKKRMLGRVHVFDGPARQDLAHFQEQIRRQRELDESTFVPEPRDGLQRREMMLLQQYEHELEQLHQQKARLQALLADIENKKARGDGPTENENMQQPMEQDGDAPKADTMSVLAKPERSGERISGVDAGGVPSIATADENGQDHTVEAADPKCQPPGSPSANADGAEPQISKTEAVPTGTTGSNEKQDDAMDVEAAPEEAGTREEAAEQLAENAVKEEPGSATS